MPSGQALHDEEVTESLVSAVSLVWYLWFCNTHTFTFQHSMYISELYTMFGWWKRFRTFLTEVLGDWAFEWDLVVTSEGGRLNRSLPEPIADSFCVLLAAQVHQQWSLPLHQNQQTRQGWRRQGATGGALRAGQLIRATQGHRYQQGGKHLTNKLAVTLKLWC